MVSPSKTQTPPPPPPPPQPEAEATEAQLEPQPSTNLFMFSATRPPQPLPYVSAFTEYTIFKNSMNQQHHSSPGPAAGLSIGGTQNLPLPPIHNLSLGPTAGFTLGDSGLNPAYRFSPSGSSFNPASVVMNERTGVEKPVEPVEASARKFDEKGKAKVSDTIGLPKSNKGSGTGHVIDEGDDDDDDDDDGEAEESCDDEEEPNFVKNWNVKEDDEAKKTWNLRPRKEVPKPAASNAGESRSGGRRNRQGGRPRARPRPAQATPTRSRAASTAAEAAAPRRPMFSVSLTKEEIEEDFLKMTGAKPPKKFKKRPKNMQILLDACFPGTYLNDVTLEKYKVPDPPLKHAESKVVKLLQKNGAIL